MFRRTLALCLMAGLVVFCVLSAVSKDRSGPGHRRRMAKQDAPPRYWPHIPQADSLLRLAHDHPSDSVRCQLYWRAFLLQGPITTHTQVYTPYAAAFLAAAQRWGNRRYLAAAQLPRVVIRLREGDPGPQLWASLDSIRKTLVSDSLRAQHEGMLAAERGVRVYWYNLHSEDRPAAMRCLLQGIVEGAAPKPPFGFLAQFYGEIALRYGQEGHKNEVLDYYAKARYCARRAGLPGMEGMSMVNMSDIYWRNGKQDSAMILLENGRRKLEKQQMWYLTGVIDLNINELYAQLGDWPAALVAIERCLVQVRKKGVLSEHLAAAQIQKSLTLRHLQRYAEAEAALKEAAGMQIMQGRRDLRVRLWKEQADLAGAMGHYTRGLALERLLRQVQDSVEQDWPEQRRLVKEFETRKHENELAALRRAQEEDAARAARQRIFIAVAILAIVLFIGGLAWLLKTNRRLNAVREKQREHHQTIQRQYQRLAQLAATKDKLFNIIAHDLRGPVTGFIMLPDMINMAVENSQHEYVLELAKDLRHSSSTLAGLLDRLLTWAQSQNATLTYAPETLFVYTILGRQRDLYLEPAKAKNIAITVQAEDSLQVYADRDSIETALRNLVNNAVKFTEVGGTITLRGYRQGNSAVIEIRDNGIGMTAPQVRNLFQPGALNSTVGTAGEAGVGLGMLLVKELIEHNNGTITAESQPGQGSLFQVRLPLGKEVGAHAQQTAARVTN